MTPTLTAPAARNDGTPSAALTTAASLPYTPRLSRLSLAGVVLVHAGLLAVLLLSVADKAKTITPPRPLMVSLIEDEQPEPEPEVQPTPPQPVVKPQTPPPMRVAKRATPTQQAVIEAPKPDPAPEPVPEVPPPPAPVVAEAPKPAPPPPTPPRSADYLNNPKPPYPRLSNKLREEGTVQLRALINPDGSVAKLELLKSSGYERLDSSAFNTVKNSWKFEPARQNGQPVADWVNFPIEFTLKNRS
jgi:protein TonB